MKFSDIVFEPRRGACTIADAELIVGGKQILRLMRSAGWLIPAIEEKRLTRFDCEEVLAAWKRLAREGIRALKTDASSE